MKSFDIFDTVLIRKCGSAENLFYLLANKLYNQDESQRDAFFHWRCNAEDEAKKIFNREPSLKDIYSIFDRESFKDIDPKIIILLELELEKENLIPNIEVINLLNNIDDYIFISDMYLPSSFIIEILDSYGLLRKDNKDKSVFISCEFNATKASGKLYDIVKQTLRIKTWTHYGDNAWSDFKMAKRKGLTAIKINSTYSKPEQFYLNMVSLLPDKKKYEILINLQRATRLNLAYNNRVAFAIDYIAPLYIGYVLHILNTAKRRGINTLYFLSRDSYILYKIAQQYRLDYPEISLKYLFVSRKSLMYPCIYEGTSDEICELMGLKSFKDENVKRIANYLQLDEALFDSLDFKYIKTDEDVLCLNKLLDKHCEKILNKAATQRVVLLKYFKQEGLLDSGKKALVDVGWLGTSRFLINKLLGREGYETVETFYLMNFYRVLPPSKGIYNSYLGECDFKNPVVPIIENLYSASPYRSTLSYEISNNRALPVFNLKTNPAKSEIVRSNLIGVLKYIDNFKKQGMDFNDIYPLWSKLSILCIKNPSNVDLTVLTDLEDQDEIGKTKELVSKLSFFDLFSFIFGMNKSSLYSYSVYYTCPKFAYYFVKLHVLNNKIIKKIKYIAKQIIKKS